MALLEVTPVKFSVADTIRYITNPEKTATQSEKNRFKAACKEDRTFVSGINCSPETAAEEFLMVQKQYQKETGIKAHHGWQSFRPGDLSDPHLAHEIVGRLLEKTLGDRFQIVYSTHLDKEHLHSHFVINAVSFVDGKKYQGNQTTLRALRAASDELCKAYGLNTIDEEKQHGKSKGLYRAEKHGDITWRDMLAYDIDTAISQSANMPEFFKKLKEKGYLLKDGKHFAVSPPGFVKNGNRAFIRLRSLKDDDYTYEGIERRLKEKAVISYGVVTCGKRAKVYTRRKLPKLLAIYYRHLYRLGALKKKPRHISRYVVKSGQRQAESLTKKIRYMQVHQIRTEDDLKDRLAFLENRIERLQKEKKAYFNGKYRTGEKNETLICDLSEEMRALKAEVRLCKSISVRPQTKREAEMEETMQQNKKETAAIEKQEEKERRDKHGNSRSRSS